MAGDEAGAAPDRVETSGRQWAIDRARRLRDAYIHVDPARWPDEVKMAAHLGAAVWSLQRDIATLLANWPGPNAVHFDQATGKYYVADAPGTQYVRLEDAARTAGGLD